MTPRVSKIVTGIATYFPPLPVVFSGVMKLGGSEAVVQGFTPLGIVQFIPFLGAAEVLFSLLFIFKKTFKLGFILLSCYFAGAAATELSHGMTPIVPSILLVIIWVCAYIRDRSIFFNPGVPTQN